MVTLPGQCCQEPRCQSLPQPSFPTPNVTPAPHIGSCYDAIPNCNAYGQTSCVATFAEWAKQNCNLFCGFCRKFTFILLSFISFKLFPLLKTLRHKERLLLHRYICYYVFNPILKLDIHSLTFPYFLPDNVNPFPHIDPFYSRRLLKTLWQKITCSYCA